MKIVKNNFYNILKKKINKKQITAGIIGMGYVGLPLAILVAKKKFKLNCYERDQKRFLYLKKKKSYFKNIDSSELKSFNKNTQIFKNFSNISSCDIIIFCLPTPLKNNQPDLSHISNTIKLIKKSLREGQLIILESTSYPGTTREEICDKLKKDFKLGQNFFVSFSSERVNPGMNEKKIDSIPKVISGYSSNCLSLIEEFYKKLFKKIVIAKSLEIAEFSKLLENIYRSVNIAFINEMKFISEKFNLDIFEILSIANTKPYGFTRFDPGPGVGGHCIPIDPQYLHWKSAKKGFVPKFIKLSAEVNLQVTKFIFNKILKHSKKINKTNLNTKILFLGVAYKKNVDDIRASAPIRLINLLIKKNFRNIKFIDPLIPNFRLFNKKLLNSVTLSKDTLRASDIVVLATDHDKFDYNLIKQNSKFLIDCRGKYKLGQNIVRG